MLKFIRFLAKTTANTVILCRALCTYFMWQYYEAAASAISGDHPDYSEVMKGAATYRTKWELYFK